MSKPPKPTPPIPNHTHEGALDPLRMHPPIRQRHFRIYYSTAYDFKNMKQGESSCVWITTNYCENKFLDLKIQSHIEELFYQGRPTNLMITHLTEYSLEEYYAERARLDRGIQQLAEITYAKKIPFYKRIWPFEKK